MSVALLETPTRPPELARYKGLLQCATDSYVADCPTCDGLVELDLVHKAWIARCDSGCRTVIRIGYEHLRNGPSLQNIGWSKPCEQWVGSRRPRCGGTIGTLERYVRGNGTFALRWVCDLCGGNGTQSDIPRLFLFRFQIDFDDLPICQDNSLDREANAPFNQYRCILCDAPYAEAHHWAPRSIFPEWDDHTVLLCKPHHDEWHRRMREHGLRWPHELATHQDIDRHVYDVVFS